MIVQKYDGHAALAGAVVRQAIRDLRLIKSKNYKLAAIGRDAYRFLNGEGLEAWCKMFGVDVSYIRKQIGKTCDLFK